VSLVFVVIASSRDSLVGITIRYGLDVSGFESRLQEIIASSEIHSGSFCGPSSLLHNGFRVHFPRGKAA